MRILYIDIDSLRPDHLGCYGYQRPTSPTIDSIAASGVRFSNYFCTDSPCVPSRAGLVSGRPGIVNGVVAHENTPRGCTLRYKNRERHGHAPLLAAFLAQVGGMHTACFSSFANRHLAGWFHFGFREFYLTSLKNGNEDAPEVNEMALPWLERNASCDNWFVHLNYWDPHTLYTEPLEYFEDMRALPAPDWPDAGAIRRQQSDVGIRTARSLWAEQRHENWGRSRVPTMPDQIGSREDFAHLISGYDGAIRFCDLQIARVLESLDRAGVLEETAIIISADHGEAFGELGQYMEHGLAIPAVNRVPLIVKWPGVTDSRGGMQSDDLLYNIDLAPTLAELLGLPVPEGWMGRSLRSQLVGSASSGPGRKSIVISHGLHTRQRSVYDGEWLFIRTYHPSFYRYRPRMLYNTREDPYLTNDRVDADPSRAARMEQILIDWEKEMVVVAVAPDPMRVIQDEAPCIIGSPEDYVLRLEKDGRNADAAMLREMWARIPIDYAPQPLE